MLLNLQDASNRSSKELCEGVSVFTGDRGLLVNQKKNIPQNDNVEIVY